MRGCLVGLTWHLLTAIFSLVLTVLIRVGIFAIMLMVMSIASLFVGFERATARISQRWIEQATSHGVNLGYNPTTRSGMRVIATLMLVIGWLVTIGVIYVIVMLAVN